MLFVRSGASLPACVALLLQAGCAASDPASEANDAVGSAPRVAAGAKVATAPPDGTYLLALVSERRVRLAFGEQTSIEVLVTDADGEPQPEARVNFALVGRVQDATLTSLGAITNSDGEATDMLVAGMKTATFVVRVSLPGAESLDVDVAVSDAGFGTLVVVAPYAGIRTVVRRVVFAQANIDCGEAERTVGDPMASFGEADETASFLALPAGVTYAITAIGEGLDGSTVAQGCVDGVLVRVNREVEATIVWSNEPLLPLGRFALTAELDSGIPAATLSAATGSAAMTLVRTDGNGEISPMYAEGRFLLDSLEATLRSETYLGNANTALLADELSQARLNASAANYSDKTLSALLALRREGPLTAIPRVVELISDSMQTLSLSAELMIDSGSKKLPVAWQKIRLEVPGLIVDGSPLGVEVADSVEVTQSVANVLVGQDVLHLSSATLPAPFGALTGEVLRTLVGAGDEGHADELTSLLGCATLQEWLGQQSFSQANACDASCVSTVCEHAWMRLTDAGESALLTLGETRPSLTLQCDLNLQDEDGDLSAEQMSTDRLWGEWGSETTDKPGDSVFGPAMATAL